MFEEIAKKAMDRIVLFFELEDETKYSKRFKKFIFWMGYKFTPAVISIASAIILFVIAFKIYNKSGFEKTIVILMVLIILSLRNLKSKES